MRDILKTKTTCEDQVFSNYTMTKEEDWLLIVGTIRRYKKLTNYDFKEMTPIFISIYEFNGVKFEVLNTSINCLGEKILEVCNIDTAEVKEVLIDEFNHFYIKVTNIEEVFIQEPVNESEEEGSYTWPELV